ncbi:unnamed protein product [Agarophyton chilense]|eukprot:gb/GEZJ01003074.1/.p1 GENE.gb/GEZJ01003074.1/~~gb/GEZJ01003074.1/.p1  ORF type:complete len:1523 (-),score=139.04 gb/GEZJ01003074.1/:4077-8645(-)
MERAAHTEPRRQTSLTGPFMPVENLDFSLFASRAVSYPRYTAFHSDPALVFNEGASGATPALNVAPYPSIPAVSFPHPPPMPVPRRMDTGRHAVTPQSNKGQRHILGPQSAPTHYAGCPTVANIAHYSIAPVVSHGHVMASSAPPRSSSAPQLLPNFQQFAKTPPPGVSDFRSSTPRFGQIYTTCPSSLDTPQHVINERMQAAHHPSQQSTRSIHLHVPNSSVFRSSPSLALVPYTHIMDNSYGAPGSSVNASQPGSQPLAMATAIASAPKITSDHSRNGIIAPLAIPIAQELQRGQGQKRAQRQSQFETHRSGRKPTYTIGPPGAQVPTMNPVSAIVHAIPTSLPQPAHALITDRSFTESLSHQEGNSALVLAPASVPPDLHLQNAANRVGIRNLGQPLIYQQNTDCLSATTTPGILTGSRTLGQLTATETNDHMRSKQPTRKSRKRARRSTSHQRIDKGDRENVTMQKKITQVETASVRRKTSQHPQNNAGNDSPPCHRNQATEPVLPALPPTDNDPGPLLSQSHREKCDQSRKKCHHSSVGIDESNSRTCSVIRVTGATSPASPIQSEQSNLSSSRGLRAGDSNEELHVISLSPCDEDRKTRERKVSAKPSACVRTTKRSELERPTGQKGSVIINLRIKASPNAYSPVSDDTQPLLTPHSSGGHLSDPLNAMRARQEAGENNNQSLRITPALDSSAAKDQRNLKGRSRLSRNTAISTQKEMTPKKMSIPLRLRIMKPKGKTPRRSSAAKRTPSRRVTISKTNRKRVGSDGAVRRVADSRSAGDVLLKRPPRLGAKSRPSLGAHGRSKQPETGACEGATKKPTSLPAQRIEQFNGKTSEAVLRKQRTMEIPTFTPVPLEESCRNLSRTANDFDTELGKLHQDGCLKSDGPSCQQIRDVSKRKALALRCSLCADSVPASKATIHPRFSASNFFLCISCRKLVEFRLKAEAPVHCESISDARKDVLRRTALFVMVTENIVQTFPPTERQSRDISGIHACISSRTPLQLQERAKFTTHPFQIVALLRVVLRRLGVTIQKSRLRWRMQPIKLSPVHDIVEAIHQAIPLSLEDLVAGSTPAQRVWDTVFPNSKLETQLSAHEIVSKLLTLIGVRLHHLCEDNVNCCSGAESCLVQFDLLSVCATMQRAFIMVSGTLTEKLFKVWNLHTTQRFLQAADARLAHGTLLGRLPHVCSICAHRKHPEKRPFRYHSCVTCGHEICSLCMSNVMGPSEFASACTGDYKCVLCRVDSTIHGRLLRSGGQNCNVSKTKAPFGTAGPNASKMKPQLPMLHVCPSLRKRLLLSPSDEVSSIVGFSKFCEEANEYICRAGPSSIDAHTSSSAFPTKDTAEDSCTGDKKEWCFGCKQLIKMHSPGELRNGFIDDDGPMVLRCVSENCGVVMHRDCSPVEKGRRRRGGRPKWSCPRHRCRKCSYRDDSRLFKCRTCPLALCKDHMHKPSEVYIYSEKLFACIHCMKKLNPPRPCLLEKLPKRKNEFTQALNAPQAKRRRKAVAGSSAGLVKPYPGCFD